MQGRSSASTRRSPAQAQNIGFAIAIDPAKALIDQLQSGKVPAHALLGVSTQPDPPRGVEIDDVTSGSAADRGRAAGRRRDHRGRRQATITSPDDLASAIDGHQPGDEVSVDYERDGQTKTATVTLGSRPTGGD